MKFITIIAFLLGLTASIHAQQGLEAGGGLGLAYYFGDINTNFDLSHPGPAAMALARYNFNNRLVGRMSFHYGHVEGRDEWSENDFQQARNLSFRSNVWDMSLGLEFNFFPYEHWSEERWYTPYVFAGLSIFRFNPKTDLEGETYELREYGTEGQPPGDEYFLIQPAFAYGGGMKWNLDQHWAINLEFSARGLFTDYLDDVSETYPDMQLLEDRRGPIAVELSDRSIEELNQFQLGEEGRQRGNSKDNDSYNFITIGLTYFFGQVPCPAISRPDWR